MEKHILFSLESIHYGGHHLGYDLIFKFDFEGTVESDGVRSPLPRSPKTLKPKFDKHTDMALKMPTVLYQFPPFGSSLELVNSVMHIHIEEVDKSSDHGDGARLPIKFEVHHVAETHFQLELPVVSFGGDKHKTAHFLMKFKLHLGA